MITLFFTGLFTWSMYLEAYRTMPAVSILKGAVSTNLPTVVLLFYITIVIAHNFVNVKLVRGKGSIEVFAVDQMKLSELEAEADTFSAAEVEFSRLETSDGDESKSS